MNKHILVAAMAALVSCCAANGPAWAQSADIRTIVSLNGSPVVLNQSSSTNMAGIFMLGGTTSATVTQTGNNNATGILQFGGTTSASVGQTGINNFAFVGQSGQSTSSVLSQFGTINSGVIAQLGFTNSSHVVQGSP
jgi:minor curlin subunit